MNDLEVALVRRLKSSERYFSRTELAREVGRKSEDVSKAVEELVGRGYKIEEIPGEGYRLLGTPGMLDGPDIKTSLETSILGRDVVVFRVVTSTNDVAATLARAGAHEGVVVLGEQQSKGKGRLGRSWHSPEGSGLWFSVVLRPRADGLNAATISLAGALGVANALRDDYGIRAEIKWPNDVVVGAKKICGILTEGEFVGHKVNFVVMGVGLNVLSRGQDFPRELRESATSLGIESGRNVSRVEVLSKVLASIENKYLELRGEGFEGIRQQVLGLSMLMGKMIRVLTAHGAVEGMAVDIDGGGALVIRKENGSMETVIAGDVVRVT
jgi:BirA family biotin operon repressor/biotin-[acetyl-CoA-carboxylase] ligase